MGAEFKTLEFCQRILIPGRFLQSGWQLEDIEPGGARGVEAVPESGPRVGRRRSGARERRCRSLPSLFDLLVFHI